MSDERSEPMDTQAVNPVGEEPSWRGALRSNEPMNRHVSWRAGGAVAQAYFPVDLDDLAHFLTSLRHDEPLLMVGLGSNLLIRDGGFDGTAVFTHGALKTLRLESDGSIYAEAGVASPKLARFAANHDLAGAEFLAGIPGTIGGALAMNAGCYGGETWAHVERVLMLDRRGRRIERTPADFEIAYRHVGLKANTDEVFAAAWFRFPQGDGELARQRIRELLEKRIASQPLQLPNAGSVFRNPPGDHAARLIEAAGLKGTEIDGARVSEKHSNFIVNPQGAATAFGIETLIGQIRTSVAEKFGVELIREVRIFGAEAVTGAVSGAMTAKQFGKVAVMFGGDSAEREVSLKSGSAVLKALRAAGVDAHAFDPREKPLAALREEKFQRAFIALHGRGGEDGTLQGALELMGIPYTGSGVLASALGMDKWRTKLVWRAAGIPVPDFAVLDGETNFAAVEHQFGLPLFVKPANEGSSIGISKVKESGGLAAAYYEAARYDNIVLAERFMSGGEFTVGILGHGATAEALPVIRIVPATEFYDYDAKYLRDDTQYLIPSGLSPAQEKEMQDMALAAFKVLGGRGWGRVDTMIDGDGHIVALEANTAPGMTDHSLVPMAARAAGMDFTTLVLKVLAEARLG